MLCNIQVCHCPKLASLTSTKLNSSDLVCHQVATLLNWAKKIQDVLTKTSAILLWALEIFYTHGVYPLWREHKDFTKRFLLSVLADVENQLHILYIDYNSNLSALNYSAAAHKSFFPRSRLSLSLSLSLSLRGKLARIVFRIRIRL